MEDVRQMVAMVARFGAEDVRNIRNGWGENFSKRQWRPNNT